MTAHIAPTAILLSDYTPFSHLIDHVTLHFTLHPLQTRVSARLSLRPNPAAVQGQDLRLDGENLSLLSLALNGKPLAHAPDETGLTIPAADLPNGPFTLETEVEISPQTNTSLDGLYMSNGMYCTQCEAQGFRKITFYPDRPDVMARFDVTMDTDLPTQLSNGNPTGPGAWHDPWPKPAYLFALVAGDLVAHTDHFTTLSGRRVTLNIYTRAGDAHKCAYAMDSLIRSMRWDEQVYGREYDLDIFNIVAVDDFNMGAMENKGLNIFNSKLVLATPDTATDDDYARIEAVIAHEYFHNWTGNRITCRDWFQLCLKEGLTVYRDQQFSGDMRSAPVKRIEDVLALRARQFREDGGPLAHAVRPDSYVEINNFYTATIYEKGAEVIGMLKTLVGDAAYADALNLYFTRHDGHAATIEDWLQVFTDATGHDLTQFKHWYTQAGTPHLTLTDDFKNGTYTLYIKQNNPTTPGQPHKDPKVIPIALGLLSTSGAEVLPTTILTLTQAEHSFEFPNLTAKPIPSALRGFSAPVVLHQTQSNTDRAILLAHDTDPFNKWEAGRALAKSALTDLILHQTPTPRDWLAAITTVTRDTTLDPAFRALTLRLPGDDDLAQTLHASGHTPNPAAIHAARRTLQTDLANHLKPHLPTLIAAHQTPGDFSPSATDAGHRAFRLGLLSLMARIDTAPATDAYQNAKSMTEQLGALAILLDNNQGQPELAQFHQQWQNDRLVMDKWFGLQISMAAPDHAAHITKYLTEHHDFDWKNPNRFRAVIASLAANHAGFHHASGQGYALLADWLIKLDPVNPQTAARMSTAFETWPRYDQTRQTLIRNELTRIRQTPNLSRNLGEMVDRMLGA
jgi:aminopeptidase N